MVRVVSTAKAIYVGVWAKDRDLRTIRASVFRRDADLTVDDYITVLIDSFHDRRGTFLFRTNPNGAMWDAQLTGSENVNESGLGVTGCGAVAAGPRIAAALVVGSWSDTA